MIVRTWRGEATASDANHYLRHFKENVLPQLKEIAGFRGAYLLRRELNDRVEFLAMTMWESMEAVREFADDNPDKAVVEPEARAVLADFDLTVKHYEVVVSSDR
ncbi:MAG: antibiotic biosynthesis monooxygenase [Chloroflexi bacterium]|nr:antibiotic biosynthesis monooxygenase [Chloroflexota bacterium]